MKHLNISFKGVAIAIFVLSMLSSCGTVKQGFKDGWNSKKEVKK